MSKDRLQGKKTLQVADFLDELTKTDITKEIDIVDLFNHFGVKLSQKGKGYMGRCPFPGHEDKNPSLSVDREKGIYNCFGCGKSGNVITLTKELRKCDYTEASKYLHDFAGLLSTSSRTGQKTKVEQTSTTQDRDEAGVIGEKVSTTEDKPTSEKRPQTFTESITLTTITDYYHKQLQTNEKARSYLEKRGLASVELVTRFKLGFADGSMLEKISDKQKDKLKEKGILNKYNKEHFFNCITFPIIDPSTSLGTSDPGQTVGIYGRSTNEKSKVPHLYLKGEHKGVFNRKASKVYNEIILTESIIDCLSLIALGFENVQSIYGTNGFTDEHLQTLKNDRVKIVILAFDADEAGKTATGKLKEQLVTENFGVKEIAPAGQVKDWNEYLVSGGDKAKITEQLNQAEIYKSKQQTFLFSVTKDTLGHIFTIGEIIYRVSGVKDMFVTNLRVNIKAECDGEKHFDNLDLYSARSRASFSGSLGKIFDVEPKRVEKDLIVILEYLEKERDRHMMRSDNKEQIELTQEERELGMAFLQSKNMFNQVVEDMETLGYVGEDINKQLMYIAASSIKLDDPISILITSQSASGKSYLVDTVKELIPSEYIVEATSLSDQALNYISDLEHKFLILSEAVHKDVVEHQLREMVSAKQLSRMVVMKDPQTGNMMTQSVKTKAIVSTVMSTTNRNINPENASRCFIIETDESTAQTKKIHERQREKHTLYRHQEKEQQIPLIKKKHHAAQRLLEKRTIVNNLVKYIDFPVSVMRTRRDHDRFIDLMASICYLRQYQKELKYEDGFEYIECDLEDYEISYTILINGILNTILIDLPKSARALYDAIRSIARKKAAARNVEVHEVRLTQREIREATGFGQSWVKQNLRILTDYEYVVAARGGTARSKGFYRIKADEPIEDFNFSMIPSPDELLKLLPKTGQTGQKLDMPSLED